MRFTRKSSLISASIALSFTVLGTQAYADTITVQAEAFHSSGGTFNDGQTNPVGITSDGDAINFVNAGDYVDYKVHTNGGDYVVEYLVGTNIAANANIQFLVKVDGKWIYQNITSVPQTGWSNFQPIAAPRLVTLPAGTASIRLYASGANWQWNLDSFTLKPVDDVVVQLEDFSTTNKQGAAVGGDNTVGFGTTNTGINFNTSGDYADYNVTFAYPGTYKASITAATPSQGQIGARIIMNNSTVATSFLSQTGGWTNYLDFDLNGDVVINNPGTYTVRLQSHGSSTWQWNADKVTFEHVSEPAPLKLLPPVNIPNNRKINKASVWYTYPQNSNLSVLDNFGASGAFWGHMPEEHIDDPAVLSNWVADVKDFRDQDFNYMGRGEFDWGFRWFIDYVGNPTPHWARTLDNDVITMTFMGNHTYNGHPNGWLSNHSPTFVDYFKFQVDALLSANISHMMFDSQTSSTRSTDLGQFGGDFSTWAMDGFREYMRDKYSIAELRGKGINNINTFNYRTFLLNTGYTHASYMADANRITSGIPLFDDFIYFNRDVLNEKMTEILTYIRSKDATIEIGSTTALSEARGYIFNDDLTFLAGELAMASTIADEMPIPIITHLKNAEAVDKTLIYFPYPFDFENLYNRNSPRMARTWIAQSYAMGALFSIPANVWIGEAGVWTPGADNYRDLYQFADNNSTLFDNYDAYSKVGLVSPMMASLDATWINGSNNMQSSIRYLIEHNLNFDVLPFGDPGHPFAPTQVQLDDLDAIIVDGDRSYLTAEQNALINANSSKVINISNTAALNTLRASNISVTINGSARDETITALSRIHESNNNAPYVVHLLNRPVNPTNGTTTTLNNVRIAIPQGYFPEDITQATLRLPNGTSTNLSLSSNGNGDTVVIVNNLEVWGLIELDH